MNEFIASLWNLTIEMAPYLLLGFFIAGLLHAFVPAQTYNRYLSRPGFRSVLNATLLAIPLPLCSCGVIPTSVSLRRSGVSRGACTAFLIATPQTGVDSILATYSLLGLPFAIIRPIAALITGMAGGIVTDRLTQHDAGVHDKKEHEGRCAATAIPSTFSGKMLTAMRYAFGELLEDVSRWLLIGLLIAAAITVAVPDDFFVVLQQWPLLNMLLVLIIAIPMYVCATGSIPIALSLLLKGMTPGAVFVLLMAGPAINAASMMVIGKAFGRKQTTIYILSIVTGAICFGLFIDYFLPSAWFVPHAMSAVCGNCHSGQTDAPSLLSVLSAILFCVLVLRAVWVRITGHHSHDNCCEYGGDACHCHEATSDTRRYKVSGMRCCHCAANVREALTTLPFVESVEVDLPSGSVTITSNSAMPLDDDIIRSEIEKAGYHVRESSEVQAPDGHK